MALLEGLAVAGCLRFCVVILRSAPVAVGFSVMLNEVARERVSVVSGGSIEGRESSNKKLERETGDGASSSSWICNISLFTL